MFSGVRQFLLDNLRAAVDLIIKKKKKKRNVMPQGAPALRTPPDTAATLLVAVCGGLGEGGGEGCRALRWLFVIDLIMENSPRHRSWRARGPWLLYEKCSCCVGFCHTAPVDKARPWQDARKGDRDI